MPVPVLEAIADAIMRYEGWKPGARSYVNRNPGNLREQPDSFPRDPRGYTIFPSLEIGYRQLLDDLLSKVTGRNSHGLNADSTLLKFFSVYAPIGDGNSPYEYASFVADWLSRVYPGETFFAASTIRLVYQGAGQEVPGVKSAT